MYIEKDKIYPVWDKSVIDGAETTANFILANAVRKEKVFTSDREWEGNTVNYPVAFYDDGIYRMYYLAHFTMGEIQSNFFNTYICYAESKNGIDWVKPALGICEYKGSKENNIILRTEDLPNSPNGFFDNFFVFKDGNPACEKDKKYKALAYYHEYKLSTYYSADGIHFHFWKVLDLQAQFDTLNTCFFDEKIGKYVAYIRGFHDIPANGDLNLGKRDIRRTESENFVDWSEPELLDFGGAEDYPLYTNNAMRYYRNPDIYIGFPTRYIERPEWTPNYDELRGREIRLKRYEQVKRYGLAMTDCVFMYSRDGKKWNRYEEAIFTPGPENGYNWVYGDCYPMYFVLETKDEFGNAEMSMFMPEQNNDGEKPANIVRYAFRVDGFGYYSANYKGARLVTKEFECDGDELYINFSTSARGSVFIKAVDGEGDGIASCETFGDSISRKVVFSGGALAQFKGKNVRLEFEMKDAKVFSFYIK